MNRIGKAPLMRIALLAVLALCAALPAGVAHAAGYAGSVSCRECHEKFYRLWSTSRHGLAMQPYTAEFAKKSLSPQTAEVRIGKLSYRAEVSGSTGWVRQRGPGGEKNIESNMSSEERTYIIFSQHSKRAASRRCPWLTMSGKKSGSTPRRAASATSREDRRDSGSTGKTRHTPSTLPATAAT